MRINKWLNIPALFVLMIGCTVHPDALASEKSVFRQRGEASYYARNLHGQETASGEIFNNNKLVAAHKTLPLGSKVQVTNLQNNKAVTVRINDRGPFKRGRIIDLSRAAAKKIDLLEDGTAPVRIVRID